MQTQQNFIHLNHLYITHFLSFYSKYLYQTSCRFVRITTMLEDVSSILDELNSAQREAVCAPNQPLLILAGVLMFTGIGVFLALIPWTLAEIVQIGLMIYLIQKIGRRESPIFYS